MPDAYKVTVKDLEFFDETVAEIKGYENVLQIKENSDLAGKLASIRNAVHRGHKFRLVEQLHTCLRNETGTAHIVLIGAIINTGNKFII